MSLIGWSASDRSGSRMERSMALRAKMRPNQKVETGAGGDRQVQVQFHVAGGPENLEWSRFTPSGSLSLTLKGDLADQLTIGKDYYVDIAEATDA